MRVDSMASVIVVNWNGRHFLADCLGALERQTMPRHRYEILLIDNASSDGSVDFARAHFPGVRVHALERNLGFTGANNLGFGLARGRSVVLLNNDTRVEPDWLAGLLAACDTDRRIGGATSRLLFRDRPGVVNSTGLILYRDGRGGDRDLGRVDDGATQIPSEVFGGCGASLLLKRELLDEVGGFDPRLFMYYEDLDLCWRARLRGWRFVYAPASIVHHVCGGSTKPASLLLFRQIERNRALVALKNGPPFVALAACAGLLARMGRTWARFLTARRRHRLTWRHLAASFAAVVSTLLALPEVLVARYDTRSARCRAADRTVARFMERRPAA